MASIREQIIVRAMAALSAATSLGANVERSRENPIARANSSIIVIAVEEESVQRWSQGVDRCELVASFKLYIRGDPWDEIADPIAVKMHYALMNDAQLQQLASDLRREAAQWNAEEADRTAGVLETRYRFIYLSRASDLESPPRG